MLSEIFLFNIYELLYILSTVGIISLVFILCTLTSFKMYYSYKDNQNKNQEDIDLTNKG